MERELHELIEQESKRPQGQWDPVEVERPVACRLIVLWLGAFAYCRRNIDPGKQSVAGQRMSDVVKALVHLRPRGKAQN